VRESGLDAIVHTLPRGLDTQLGRGFGDADLSRGQWQRVAIARALAHDPGLLILDEPTANLDAEAEERVYAAVRELARGRTTVLISHRFSTVRLADTIFVLEAGRLVESGSHRELIAANGLYSRLYRLHHPAEAAGPVPAGSDPVGPSAAFGARRS
jgi:ABC-type multidrug transport system fused ATPase/permease subunit